MKSIEYQIRVFSDEYEDSLISEFTINSERIDDDVVFDRLAMRIAGTIGECEQQRRK